MVRRGAIDVSPAGPGIGCDPVRWWRPWHTGTVHGDRHGVCRQSVPVAPEGPTFPVECPPLSLAVFRIALGTLLVWDLLAVSSSTTGSTGIMFFRSSILLIQVSAGWLRYRSPGFNWHGWRWACRLSLLQSDSFTGLPSYLRQIIFIYFFLLEKAEYLNHFYLVILFLILMCFLPAERVLSIDARRRRTRTDDSVPLRCRLHPAGADGDHADLRRPG